MDCLVDELLTLLFSHVTDVNTLLTCVTVCATWQRILCDARYWTRMLLKQRQAEALLMIYGETHMPRISLLLNPGKKDEPPWNIMRHATHLEVDSRKWELADVIPHLRIDLISLNWKGVLRKISTMEPMFPQLKTLIISEEVDDEDETMDEVSERAEQWQCRWAGRQTEMERLKLFTFRLEFVTPSQAPLAALVVISICEIDREGLFHLITGAHATLENLQITTVLSFDHVVGRNTDSVSTHQLMCALTLCRRLKRFHLDTPLIHHPERRDATVTFQTFPDLTVLDLHLTRSHESPVTFLPCHAKLLIVGGVFGSLFNLLTFLQVSTCATLRIRERFQLSEEEEQQLIHYLKGTKCTYHFYPTESSDDFGSGFELNIDAKPFRLTPLHWDGIQWIDI